MPPPDAIRRTNSMGNMGSMFHLDPLPNQNNVNGQNGVNNQGNVDNQNNVDPQNNVNNLNDVNGQVNVEGPQDPEVDNIVDNGLEPNLGQNGQAQNFAANHHVALGRDWDLNSAKGVLDTAKEAIKNIKTVIAGKEQLDDLKTKVNTAFQQAIQAPGANTRGNIADLVQSFTDIKQTIEELKGARAALTAAIKDGSGQADPREGIAEIRKTLRVFRYEMQRELARQGSDVGRMDFYEGALREIQHKFTFGVGSKVAETFARVMQLEAALDHSFTQFCNRLSVVSPGTQLPEKPANVKLANVAGDALELSHLTNDRIRDFQDADASSATLRDILGEIASKGGSRKVEFNVGVGALIGLGFSSVFTAGVRAGARFRVIGEIDCPGKGRPISATFRIAGGLDGKIGIKAGDEGFVPGAKAEAGVTGGLTHFTTRTYATLEDLILDAKNCKLATSRTIGGAIWGGIKSLGRGIGKLGATFFRWLGRKGGEVKQDNAQYLESLKARGVAGAIDRLVAKRANPVIVAERRGWSGQGQIYAKAGITLGKDVVSLSASGKASYEQEFKVKSKTYTGVARVVREARHIEDINALMRPDPDTNEVGQVARFGAGTTAQEAIESLETAFDAAIDEAADVSERRVGFFRRTDKAGFAHVAYKIRSLLLATEAACLDNVISRADADRILARYSNPPVKFPTDIYREYFMDGTGAAKPAKRRISAEAKFKFEFLPKLDKTLTAGIDNSFGKVIAGGAINTLKREVGMETAIQYRFSRESPVSPGADPRPWENTVKTKHEMLVTASAPARYILDGFVRSYINKGERVENRSENLKKDIFTETSKDIGKDTAMTALYETLPGLILAGVKETAIAGVKKWLSNPENVQKLIEFAFEHLDDAFQLMLDVAEFAVKHPDLTLHAIASIRGAESTGESERAKKITWSYVDGQLESVAISHDSESKIGANVDPVGIAVGVGFDLSYSVTESVKERDITPRPTLTMLMDKGEQFLFGETEVGRPGSGQPFKTWLARNAMGVSHMLAHLTDTEENKAKTIELYNGAMAAAGGDMDLQERLQNAWHRVEDLGADATLDAKVDAAHELITAMLLAYLNPAPDYHPAAA